VHKPLLFTLLIASASAHAEWNFEITPYLWGIDTELNTNIDDVSGELEFNDLIDKLDFAAQVRFEASTDNWGILVDATNLQLSDQQVIDTTQVDTDTELWLGEVAGLWAIGNEETTRIEILLGARVISLDLDLELQAIAPAPPSLSEHNVSETLVDGMIGLRHQQLLGERWSVVGRGDVATGDTKLTWNVSLLIGYRLGPGAIRFGYRYMHIDFDNDGPLDTEMTIQGPELGYSFRF
jgi:hypothetical protein